MNKITRFVVCMISVCLTVLLPGLAWPADEDVAVSVYLTFDPVTGKLTEAPAKPQSNHNPGASSYDIPVAEVDQQAVVDTPVAATGSSNPEQAGMAASTASNKFIVWGGIGIVLLVGIGYLARKYKQKPAP